MLRLDKIRKTYKTADMEVQALKGVSLNFRRNEFVSILGPSGCGKTTLLNVIGGLDHYDDGDLVILGKSTKDFKDHDWDVYRNHRIGFVFQSYNLIPQNNVQQNVELGLTISGMGKKERERLAREALDKVGLQGLYRKLPNQLSGGQCQRVAIARAIVNNPDIILADEPTGALDSVTSVQIMDILKEISRERLIIMVTHNPDLAEKYSTRIINLLDGEVVGDSMPYSSLDEEKEREASADLGLKSNLSRSAEEEKAKMSWATAFALSARNLWAKAKRTVMTVVASSIGIVGVSAVLAVSSGVTNYIVSVQDDMLSGNPITISKSSLSITNLMTLSNSVSATSEAIEMKQRDGYVNVTSVIEQLVDATEGLGNSLTTNDITSDYVAFVDDMPKRFYAAMDKDYGIDPLTNLYTNDLVTWENGAEKEVTRSIAAFVNYAVAIISQTEYSTFADQIPAFTDLVGQSIDNESYVLSQYDVVSGKFPTAENEMMLVLNHSGKISDLILTMLGYYSQEDLMNYIYYYGYEEDDPIRVKYFTEERQKQFQESRQISIEKLMAKTFHYYPNDTIFSPTTKQMTVGGTTRDYDTFNYAYEEDPAWLNYENSGGMEMKIVGVLKPKESVSYGCLDQGLYYTPSFTKRFIKDNIRSEVASQIASTGSISSVVTSTYDSQTHEIVYSETNVTYNYDFYYYPTSGNPTDNPLKSTWHAPVGTSTMDITSALSAWFSMASGGSASTTMTATMTKSSVGGSKIPTKMSIYPNSFETKFEVTDYLDKWNNDEDIVLSNGDLISRESRSEINYTDNLELIISLINQIIEIVTIALVAFTSLSLVVSTVMIGIITYVSVMERVKEIGVIRSLGGRKRDVSHLFNAETFMIGGLSGIFGIAVTYLIELIVNLIIHANFGLYIMALPLAFAGIVIVISILLTSIAGVMPAAGAARKDPVTALRTE
ncbi:MAG: ABC transporter ATP-binding protein/permease [Bacilli bacterium]|nr:ABC transporter ATP-binding protein/permease [Bacilli bacterium]